MDPSKPTGPVRRSLNALHPLVASTREILLKASEDEFGMLLDRTLPRLDVRVSREQLDRALRVMDTLIRGCEGRGFRFEIRGLGHQNRLRRGADYYGNADDTSVIAEGQRLKVELAEKWRLKTSTGHDNSDCGRGAGSSSGRPAIEGIPSGILEISAGWPYRWKDKKRKTLEAQLGEIVDQIADHAQKLNAEAANSLRMERAAEAEGARLHREKEKARDLDARITAWRFARDIREFVAAAEAELCRTEAAELPDGTTRADLTWALTYADKIDPLRSNHPDSSPHPRERPLGLSGIQLPPSAPRPWHPGSQTLAQRFHRKP